MNDSSNINNLEAIKVLLENKIPDSKVHVSDLTGTEDHLNLLVVSDQFKGKMLIEQHQIVMDALRESLKDKIHAVQIKTMTNEAFTKLQEKSKV